ncbi:hypothetical protein N7523_007517 [Penicillium sp. IBT 18751x]|nr:hypothetical protein N7523_007517 [Penicillium sp. IBT 18751x]
MQVADLESIRKGIGEDKIFVEIERILSCKPSSSHSTSSKSTPENSPTDGSPPTRSSPEPMAVDMSPSAGDIHTEAAEWESPEALKLKVFEQTQEINWLRTQVLSRLELIASGNLVARLSALPADHDNGMQTTECFPEWADEKFLSTTQSTI